MNGDGERVVAAWAGPARNPIRQLQFPAWYADRRWPVAGLSKAPSLIINLEPPSSPAGGPSSAGWNRNFTVP